MNEPKHQDEDDFVPLAQAGISKPDVDRQVEKLCHSEALEGKQALKNLLKHLVQESLAGNLLGLRVPTITKALFRKYDPGDSRVRGDTGRLRGSLDAYFASEAKAGETRFTIPARQYVVYAPRLSADSTQIRAHIPPETLSIARIMEFVKEAKVSPRELVRTPCLWLIVRAPDGVLYPQCRVGQRDLEWQEQVCVSSLRMQATEDAVYEIYLVATDDAGDAMFRQYLTSDEDGFGRFMPTDCIVLVAKPVKWRDLRPKI
jgi:hypothetical protein